MESLGFIDAPARVWSTPPPAVASNGNGSSHESYSTTGLVTLPTGKHSRHAEPTGELVRDIWDSTDLDAPSLVDWAPEGFGTKHLGRRRFRWPMLLALIALALTVAGAALWLYREPSNDAATALGQVQSEAVALSNAIDVISPLVDDLDADRLPEANQDASIFFDMGERARSMFAASASLPADDTGDRSAAAEAAGLAIEASRQLMDTTAYRTALEPALTLPPIETDPALADLTAATEAFTEWRTGFESTRDALPVDVAAQASSALDDVISGLETTQTTYLDALATGNRTAAVEAIGSLRADLQSVRHSMLVDIGAVATTVSTLLDDARAELDRLLG
ncbi:MAG: hypothetical protein ACRDX9_00940 [Acidimicrobiia bacterium]